MNDPTVDEDERVHACIRLQMCRPCWCVRRPDYLAVTREIVETVNVNDE